MYSNYLHAFDRMSFVLWCENWDRYDLKALLKLVESFILLIWDTRKNKFDDQDGETSGCSCSCPLTGNLTSSTCVCGCVVIGMIDTAAT